MHTLNQKIQYIKKNHEFQAIFSYRKQIVGRNFILFYKKNNMKYSRFGLSVGKKLGNAVFRNKTKRQLRHMLNNFNKNNPSFFKKSLDVVILVRKNYCFNIFFDNEIKLNNLLKKIS